MGMKPRQPYHVKEMARMRGQIDELRSSLTAQHERNIYLTNELVHIRRDVWRDLNDRVATALAAMVQGKIGG